MRLDRLLLSLALVVGVVVATPATAHADDTTPPDITIHEPLDGQDFLRGDPIPVQYSCVDETDPAPSCEGQIGGIESPTFPAPSGEFFGVTSADTYTLTVTTSDASGNSDVAMVSFTVDERMCRGQVVTVIRDLGEEPTAGPDVIQGSISSRQETLGLGGNDIICAGPGVVEGGPGNDSIYGTPGSDYLFGGTGNDRIEGGVGNDRIEGDEGADSLLGGSQSDRIEGGSGNDTVNGGPQSDSCHGQEGTRDTKAQCEIGTGFP